MNVKIKMKIGLLLSRAQSLFTSGCVQQTLFLKKTLINCGFDVDFLSLAKDYTNFEMTNDPITFTDNNFDFSTFNIVICASLILSPENNGEYITNLKSFKNVKLVCFVCGNVFVLNHEEIVFSKHNILYTYLSGVFDETWILGMYSFSKDYMELLMKNPVRVLPHIWDNNIVDMYIENNCPDMSEIKNKNNTSKVNLLIFEPNVSIHKTCLVPILIAEKYYIRYGHRVSNIFIFCANDIKENLIKIFHNLEIFKDKKVEILGRVIMPHAISSIQSMNSFLNIVVSHNIKNELNFLHLEMFHLGIPIVHNCKPYEENGLYYEDGSEKCAIDLIEYARLSYDDDTIRKNTTPILDRYRPCNKKIIIEYSNACLDTVVSPKYIT
jgi:hypothetical protein